MLLAIPTSLIATFGVMYALGFSLNMMSMMALALTVGILVDDSIVVLENIFRHLELGEDAVLGRPERPKRDRTGGDHDHPRRRGRLHAGRVHDGIVGAVLPTVRSGDRRRDALLLVCFVHAHADAGIALAEGEQSEQSLAAGGFRPAVGGVLRARAPSLRRGSRLVASISMGGCRDWVRQLRRRGIGLVATNRVGSEFLPVADQGIFSINAQMPIGTTLSQSDAAVKQLEAQLKTIPEVQNVFTGVGVAGQGAVSQPRYANLTVKLVPLDKRQRSVTDVVGQVRAMNGRFPG